MVAHTLNSKTKLLTSKTDIKSPATGETVRTVGINNSIRKRAKMHATNLGLTLKEFTEQALLYFVKYQLNPLEVNKVEEVPKEMHKLRNQVFAFLKTQEQQYIIPLLKEVYAVHEHSKNLFEDMGSLSGEFSKVYGQLEHIYLLLFKIKTIQDISLTTLYQLSDQDEIFLKELIERNKQQFLKEINHFQKDVEIGMKNNEQVSSKT
jgi:hypothetical protein